MKQGRTEDMKVAKVRDGEKFVLDDRGGVWEKVGAEEKGAVKARCFFGPRDVYGTEIMVDPNAYCYVIFEDRPKPFGRDAAVHREAVSVNPGSVSVVLLSTKIRIIDASSEELIQEIVHPTQEQLLAMSVAETIRLVPAGKRNPRVFGVSERAYDVGENAFYVSVMAERCGEKDDEDESRHGRDQG